MKKTFKFLILLSIIIMIIGGYKYYKYLDYNSYYESGENDTFNVKVGETLKIKLFQNASTGSIQCWLNEKNLYLSREKNEYQLRYESQKDCIGCGGLVILNFKALKKGTDTIKIANCPVLRERKKISDYTDKNTESENEFIVKITE